MSDGASPTRVKEHDIVEFTAILSSLSSRGGLEEIGVDRATEWMVGASANADIALLEALLDAGVPPDLPDADGWTPLMTAILAGHVEVARYLLERGADPFLETRGGLTALAVARNQRASEMLDLLGDVPPVDDGWRLLFAELERRDVVRFLESLDEEKQVDTVRPDGMTLLMLAIRLGELEVADALLEKGAQVDRVSADGSTALLLAIQGEAYEMVDRLLEYGADPNGPRFAVMPPLAAALFRADAAIAHRLLQTDAVDFAWQRGGEETDLRELALQVGLSDVAVRIDELRRGPEPVDAGTRFAEYLESGDAPALQEFLISGQLDPDLRLDDTGVTPLMATVLYEPFRGDIFQKLLEAGANASLQDVNGRNVFHHAAMAGEGGAIWQLLRAVNRGSPSHHHDVPDALGRTPLHYAVLENSVLSVSGLVGSNTLSRPRASIHQHDRDGISPLMLAVLSGHQSIVSQLLQHDDSRQFHAVGDQTNLQDIARRRGDFGMLALLPYDRVLEVSGDGALTADERKQVQTQLKEWGFYGGAIDGIWGAGTYAALNAFFREQREELIRVMEVVQATGGRTRQGPKSTWRIHGDLQDGETVQLHYEPNHHYQDLPQRRYYFQTVYRASGRSREDDYTYIGPFSFQGANWGLHWRWWGGSAWEIGLYRRDRPGSSDDRWPERQSLHIGG